MIVSLAKHTSDELDELIALLEELIVKPPVNSRVVRYTPIFAEYILRNKNSQNRPRKPAKIKEYAAAMTAGEWSLTGDTIKFGRDGLLKDGQNRLSACVASGAEFVSHTVFGIDPLIFARLDIGRTRNPADIFTIAGITYSSDMAAVVRWLVILTSGKPLDRQTWSNEYLLERYRQDFSDAEPSMRIGQQVRKMLGYPTGAMGALHYLFKAQNPGRVDEFFDKWLHGRFEKRSDPVKFLQERLVSIKNQNHGRVHDGVRNALVIIAWNAFVSGERVTQDAFNWHIGQEFPTIKR